MSTGSGKRKEVGKNRSRRTVVECVRKGTSGTPRTREGHGRGGTSGESDRTEKVQRTPRPRTVETGTEYGRHTLSPS